LNAKGVEYEVIRGILRVASGKHYTSDRGRLLLAFAFEAYIDTPNNDISFFILHCTRERFVQKYPKNFSWSSKRHENNRIYKTSRGKQQVGRE